MILEYFFDENRSVHVGLGAEVAERDGVESAQEHRVVDDLAYDFHALDLTHRVTFRSLEFHLTRQVKFYFGFILFF